MLKHARTEVVQLRLGFDGIRFGEQVEDFRREENQHQRERANHTSSGLQLTKRRDDSTDLHRENGSAKDDLARSDCRRTMTLLSTMSLAVNLTSSTTSAITTVLYITNPARMTKKATRAQESAEDVQTKTQQRSGVKNEQTSSPMWEDSLNSDGTPRQR